MPEGFTEAEVKNILFIDFLSWMRGQSVGVGKYGNVIYYAHDVIRYRKYAEIGFTKEEPW